MRSSGSALVTVVALALSAAPAPSAGPTLPCRQPQLAAAATGVHLVCAEGTRILTSRSTDGGRTFGPLTLVADVPALPLGMHRGPRIAAAGDHLVVSAIVGRAGARGGASGDVQVWRSADAGATWSGPMTINDVPDAAREGLHALAARGPIVAVAWLDLRHEGTRLYMARSDDGGASWGADREAYAVPSGTICQCCHPSLAIAGNGDVLAMFRNALDGHRDMYVRRVPRNGALPAAEKLGMGSWPLDACPMDGGAIAAADGTPQTTWRREQEIYVAAPGAPEKAIGTGRDPALAIGGGIAWIAWTAPDGVRLRRLDGEAELLDDGGGFASMVAMADGGLVVAWERNGTTHIARRERQGS